MPGVNVLDVTDASFQRDVIEKSHENTVVVDFWAPWCGPCRMLGPILERLAGEPNSQFLLTKVNVDNNPLYAQQFQVQGIPAVKAFRDGKMVGGFVGAQPEPMVRKFLDQVAPASSSAGSNDGDQLYQAGKWSEASSALQETLSVSPGRTDIRLKMTKCLIRLGQGCEAQQRLQGFPPSPEYEESQRLIPLSALLCGAGRVKTNGSDVDQLFGKVAGQISAGDFGAALYNLLSVIRHDKFYRDGQPKDVMLGLFALLGEDHDMTKAYRPQLANALW